MTTYLVHPTIPKELGLANRLRVIFSAIDYARYSGDRIQIGWSGFWDLFSYNEEMSRLGVIDPNDLSPTDYRFSPNHFYPLGYKDGISGGAIVFDVKTGNRVEMTFEDRMIEHGTSNEVIRKGFEVHPILDSLQATPELLLQIQGVFPSLSSRYIWRDTDAIPNSLGMHARGDDHPAAKREDRATRIQNAADRLDRLMHEYSFVFLATDDRFVESVLSRRFPSLVVSCGQSVMERYKKSNLIHAMRDIFVLSRCEELWTTTNSSFSELAIHCRPDRCLNNFKRNW